jgi:hypothetical protein
MKRSCWWTRWWFLPGAWKWTQCPGTTHRRVCLCLGAGRWLRGSLGSAVAGDREIVRGWVASSIWEQKQQQSSHLVMAGGARANEGVWLRRRTELRRGRHPGDVDEPAPHPGFLLLHIITCAAAGGGGLLDYIIRLASRERGSQPTATSLRLFGWHISACLGLFPLTEYYPFYQPSTIHSASRTASSSPSQCVALSKLVGLD